MMFCSSTEAFAVIYSWTPPRRVTCVTEIKFKSDNANTQYTGPSCMPWLLSGKSGHKSKSLYEKQYFPQKYGFSVIERKQPRVIKLKIREGKLKVV